MLGGWRVVAPWETSWKRGLGADAWMIPPTSHSALTSMGLTTEMRTPGEGKGPARGILAELKPNWGTLDLRGDRLWVASVGSSLDP